MKKRKTWIWVLVIVLILLAIIGFVLLNRSGGNSSRYAEETARTGSIETYYSFSGNMEVRNSQNLAAKTNATVREIYVQQDGEVHKGDALLRLSNGDILKADITGEVTEVHVSVGDTVSPGTALVDIIDFDNLQVVMKVDEFDVGAVTVGKEASVTVDALGMTYDAVVEHISKHAQTNSDAAYSTSSNNDVTYYEAKLSAPSDERVLPGMKVDVKILSAREDSAVLLPMTALQFDDYNKPYVNMRSSSGEVITVSVGVGIQDGTTVQITDGLRSGDIVLVPQSRSMFPMMDQMR